MCLSVYGFPSPSFVLPCLLLVVALAPALLCLAMAFILLRYLVYNTQLLPTYRVLKGFFGHNQLGAIAKQAVSS